MSYCRARQVTAQRRGWEWKDPLAPGTDLRHRRIRRVELVIDRTDEASGRDEKDVGVRSCNCGVAEKKRAASNGSRVSRSRLTRRPEPYSVWNGALLGCAGARMVLSAAAIVQQ